MSYFRNKKADIIDSISSLLEKYRRIEKEEGEFLKIKEIIPDVEITHTAYSHWLYAKSVNNNYDKVHYKTSSSCDDGYNDPVWASPIKVINDTWIHGDRIIIARRSDYFVYGHWDWEEEGWIKDAEEKGWSNKLIETIKEKLETYLAEDEEDDTD